MRVTATGEATALAHIIAAVQRAQTSRADIQRLGDRVSNVFVPVVVVIALAAGLWWGLAPESAEAVATLARVISLARARAGRRGGGVHHRGGGADRRLSVRDGSGHARRHHGQRERRRARGILIRDGVALEKAGQVTAVIFDKTGTLTMGSRKWRQSGRRARRR